MKDLRLWAVVLSAAWFLAGLSAGYLVSASPPEPSPLARYADELTAEFELDARRRRGLLQVLDHMEQEQKAIRRRHESATREAMEPDLRRLYHETEDLIRNTILPPDRRARFDALKTPLTVTTRG